MRAFTGGIVCLGLVLAFAAGCRKAIPPSPALLKQRGYLWQRNWNGAVTAAAREAGQRLDGLVLLGAEIEWRDGHPAVIKADIPWETFRGKPVALGLRVAPFPGPFAGDDAVAHFISDTAKSLVQDAVSRGADITEFQLDFDCAQKKLAGYACWVRAVRRAVAPVPLVITALPGWLGEPEFPALARGTGGYVLQVHSVPLREDGQHRTLCDPQSARRWIGQASQLGITFSVALPTYRCLAGYAPDGKLLGVAMDSVPLAWPRGTKVLEFASNADELAELVAELRDTRPEDLKELIWYRVPVPGDVRNWRWPTLAAVMQGSKPERRLEVVHSSGNPMDLAIVNRGESDEPLDCEVRVAWEGTRATASDALAGWELKMRGNEAAFVALPAAFMRLSPGERSDMGWIRYEATPPVRVQIASKQPGAPR